MANTLKVLRRFRNKTQRQLSDETGITVRTIQNYETDVTNLRKASYENVLSIANALNVNVDDIFLDDISEFLKLPN